jgi:hypothetical protein
MDLPSLQDIENMENQQARFIAALRSITISNKSSVRGAAA